MDILDTTSHANAIITDLVKIAEKKGATEGSTPKTIAAGINLITNTLSGNEEAKSPVIVRALDELVNAVGSGGGGSSDFVICLDSKSVITLELFTQDITGSSRPDVQILKKSMQSFSSPVYFIEPIGYTLNIHYGSITEMGHILGDSENPIYYKVESDLYITIISK